MSRNALSALVLSLCFVCLPALAQDEERPLPPEGKAEIQDGPQPLSAQELADACNPPAAAAQADKDAGAKLCDAYLGGLSDGLFMLGALQTQGMTICLPDDGPVSPGEAKAELKDYVTDHPEALDHSAGVAVTFAIIAAHPCE